MTTRSGGGALAKPEDRATQMMRAVSGELSSKRQFLKEMLPKEITPERMRALVLTSFRKNPALLNCDIASILGAVYEAAKVGLEPDTASQECHLIPYKGKATFQLGFRGMMKLSRRGATQQIWADAVRQQDEFAEDKGAAPRLIHRIKKEHDNAPWNEHQRGDLIAAYACARFSDGYVQFRVVYGDEVARARKAAQTSNVWNAHPEAMWCKTAVKRLCKMLPTQDAMMRVIQLDDTAEDGGDQRLGEKWKAAPTDEGKTDDPGSDPAYHEDPDPDAHYPGD